MCGSFSTRSVVAGVMAVVVVVVAVVDQPPEELHREPAGFFENPSRAS